MSSSKKTLNRRNFIKGAAGAAGLIAAGSMVNAEAKTVATTAPQRKATNKTMMDVAAPKLDKVRYGIIGVGLRGQVHLRLICNIDGAEVVAISDVAENAILIAKGIVAKADRNQPTVYTGPDDNYKAMLERDDIDAILIATPWRFHKDMALDAMNAGKHAFVEVPAGLTVDDCWELVETSERTRKNCMMMENVNYGRDELMALNMVRRGVLGDLLHGEAAYIHDLRSQMKENPTDEGIWRPEWHARRNANFYPTHGLGPVMQYMNVNRGDRFDYLTSMSSPSMGRQLFAEKNLSPDHQFNKMKFINGDMNSSLIKTVKGRSILVQHDTTSPRPYTRLNLIQGTSGTLAGFPTRVAIEGRNHHRWETDVDKLHAEFDHPLWKKIEKDALRNGGHGGMDYVMHWRMVYCLRNGVPLDQNVYDAAAMSSIVHLSEQSVANRSNSVDVPDFTRGAWENAKSFEISD